MKKKLGMIIATVTLSGFMTLIWGADIKNNTEPKNAVNRDAICAYDTCTIERVGHSHNQRMNHVNSTNNMEVKDSVKGRCRHWYRWFPGHRESCNWNRDREEAHSRCKGNTCC